MQYQQLIDQWEAEAAPTPNQSKRVRSALCRLAEAVRAADWKSMEVQPREVAEDETDAYLRHNGYASSSRHTYLSNLRLIYDWAEKRGVIDRNGHGSDDHWPILNGQPWASKLKRRQRNAYDHFRRYALAKRISKTKVRSEDLVLWAEHQRTELRDRHYRKQFSRLREAWPILVEFADVPDINFPELPSRKNGRYALPLAKWPASIRKEWRAICQKATSRWNHEGRHAWRKTTVGNYANLISRVLGWSKAVGRFDELDCLSAILSPRTIQDFVDWLVERTGRASLNQGHGAVIRAAKSINALYLDPEESVLDEFKKMQREDLTAVVDKAYLVFPYGELEVAVAKAIDRIVDAKKRHKAGRISLNELGACYVDAIIFTLLVTRGLRSQNIRMIRLDKHVIERDGALFLRFDKTEMKNHIDFETTVPDVLRQVWNEFVVNVRPKVASSEMGQHLLFTRNGTPFSSGAFGQRVERIGMKFVERIVQPHLYRHLLGCHIARDLRLDPATLQRMLGHKNLSTTFTYYAPVSPAEAARLVDETFNAGGNEAM